MANKNPNKENMFKKGKSGNPNGRPTLPPEIKEIKNMTVKDLETMVSALMTTTQKELDRIRTDENEPMIKRIIVQILYKTFTTGNMAQFDLLLNRLIGKVKEKIEHEITRPSILVRKDGSEVVFTSKKEKE